MIKGISNCRDHFVNDIDSPRCRLHPKESSVRPSRRVTPLERPSKGAVFLLQPFGCNRNEKRENGPLDVAVFNVMSFTRPEPKWSQSQSQLKFIDSAALVLLSVDR